MKLTMEIEGRETELELPDGSLLYHVAPERVEGQVGDWKGVVERALNEPVGSPALQEIVEKKAAKEVAVAVDDGTRPTPQEKLLPPLLDELNAAGVEDEDILLLIALGTHRYMSEEEIYDRFGTVPDRVRIINHRWKEEEELIDLGETEEGKPIQVNRRAVQADLLIGVGGIVPHVYAGWGGGGKIVQPGLCSERTTAWTHLLAADREDPLSIAGQAENSVRQEMENIARMAGLDFIVNVVLDGDGGPAGVVAGDPVKAHRKGVEIARDIFTPTVPELADIVVIDGAPATKDYWQGVKPLANAQRGLREGGTAILVAEFPEGVAATHPEMEEYGRLSRAELLESYRKGELSRDVSTATLLLHGILKERCRTIVVSAGMSEEEKESLGFEDADNLAAALEKALKGVGEDPKIGLIEQGGDLLPQVSA